MLSARLPRHRCSTAVDLSGVDQREDAEADAAPHIVASALERLIIFHATRPAISEWGYAGTDGIATDTIGSWR